MKKKIKDKVIPIDGDVTCMKRATIHGLFNDLKRANKMLRLQKKRLLEERNSLKKWSEDLNLLNELSKAVVSTLDTDRIVLTAYTKMQEIVPHDILSVVLFNQKKLWVLSNVKLNVKDLEEIKRWVLSAIKKIVDTHDEDDYKMAVKYLKNGTSPSHRVTKTTRNVIARRRDSLPVISRDEVPKAVLALSEAKKSQDRLGTSSAISEDGIAEPSARNDSRAFSIKLFFPMEMGDSKIGSLQLIRYSSEPFSKHDYNIASMIASTLTLALRNSEIHREVQQMATIDSLTGIFNKRYFLETLTKEFKSTMRYQTPVSLIMIDIDNFKPVNDQFGHQAGDMVLREIATLLTRSLREIDVPARYGGDEIAIILPETVIEQAFFVAKRVKRLIEECSIKFGENCIKVTASFGISSCPNPEIKTAEDMIAAADKALYDAKRYGRNRIEASKDIFTQDNAYLGPLVF